DHRPSLVEGQGEGRREGISYVVFKISAMAAASFLQESFSTRALRCFRPAFLSERNFARTLFSDQPHFRGELAGPPLAAAAPPSSGASICSSSSSTPRPGKIRFRLAKSRGKSH